MSMAIKYQMHKKAKMAKGGSVPCAAHGMDACEMCHGGNMMADGGEMYDDGGEVKPSSSPSVSPSPVPKKDVIDKDAGKAASDAFNNHSAFSDMVGRGIDYAKHLIGYAEGGEVDDDLVSSIMRKRGNSPGAKANETGPISDFEDNQFDYMVKDDDMGGKADYTGANSGDMIGNAQEDEDRHDVISQIMKSRRKKDRLPNPR